MDSNSENNQIKADMNLEISHLSDTDLAERILDLKEISLKNQIEALSKAGSELELKQRADSKFDAVFGQSVKNLKEWINNFRNQKDIKKGEYSTAIRERDKYSTKVPGEVIRKVDWTPGERFEYIFLICGSILLWLVGYLSLVQVIKAAQANSGSDTLTNVAVWLLPLAGVTVMALMIKILLTRLQGTRAFNVLLTFCIIAGLAASLTWLFCFAGFINSTSAPVALPTVDGTTTQAAATPAPSQSSGGGEANTLYIIVSILGEALGAGACYAFAQSIASSKTIQAMEDNPAWSDHNQRAEECEFAINLIDSKVVCAEGLLDSIESKKKNFEEDVIQAHKNNQAKRLEQEEREVAGGGSGEAKA